MIATLEVEQAVSAEVHRATPADRDALIAMYLSFEPKDAAMGPPPGGIESWLDRLAAYPNFLAVAEGRITGHAVLCPAGDSAEAAVFVHQDYRGQGIGRMLLTEVIHEARRLGLRRVWGVAEPDNYPMVSLARSFGFVAGSGPGEFYLDLEEADLPECKPSENVRVGAG